MALGLWVFLGWMIFVVSMGAVFLVWAWRNGQFRNVEEAKYRMLEDREPLPWPEKPSRRKEGGQP